MTMAPDGSALFLDGRVMNTGQRPVTGVECIVSFRDTNGNIIDSSRRPLEGIDRGGVDAVPDEFVKHPIKPNDMRFFRLAVKEIPADWNRNVPEVQVQNVTAQ